MSFENILADCLALLDSGATEDECLARYPDHAQQLAPVLLIAVRLRSQPAPRLSSPAFTRGRAAVQAEASRQQILMANHRRPSSAPATSPIQHRPQAQRRWRPRHWRRQPRMPRVFSAVHLMTGVLVMTLVVMSGYTFARNIGNSLPGDRIYTAKRLGENAEGALMAAAGENAAWHVRQAERRLHESLALEMIGQAPDATLTTSINRSVQSAIHASSKMPAEDRTLFLAVWLDNLHNLQTTFSVAQPLTAATSVAADPASEAPALDLANASFPAAPSITTLSQTIDAVELAAEHHADAQQLPLLVGSGDALPTEVTAAATPESANAVEMSAPMITPTDTATAKPTLTNTPTYTPTATHTNTPTAPPTATHTPTPPPTQTPTWTPVPTERPTNTPTRSSSGGNDRPTKTPTHTPNPTDTPTPQPTAAPTGSPTSTPTPEISVTGTPATPTPTTDAGTGEPSATPDPSATAQQTSEPSGTPSTPTVTATVQQTPNPSATPATPTATVEATSMPEPSATPGSTPTLSNTPETPEPSATIESTAQASTATPAPEATAPDAPANTPEPTEQVAATSAPATLATSTPDVTEEPGDSTPTPEETDAPPADTPIP